MDPGRYSGIAAGVEKRFMSSLPAVCPPFTMFPSSPLVEVYSTQRSPLRSCAGSYTVGHRAHGRVEGKSAGWFTRGREGRIEGYVMGGLRGT